MSHLEPETLGAAKTWRRFIGLAALAIVLAACGGSQPTEAEALDLTGDFFDALNTGDEEKALGLLRDDATISDSLAGELDADGARNWLVWRMAQGTSYSSPECTAGEAAGDGIVVSCTTSVLDALGAATNTSAAEVEATVELGSAGIAAVDFSYQPTIGEAPSIFVEWIETQHPNDSDAAAAADTWGDSVEVSRERGVLRAEYAQLWVDFALTSVEETFAAYENRDLDRFMGRWGGSPIIGNNRLNEPQWFEADFESGPSYTLGSCVPDGLSTGLVVHCTGSVTDAFGGRSGIVLETDWTFNVDESGLISATADLTDYEPLKQFGTRFQEWMTANHPAIQDDVEWVRPWLAAAEDWETVRPLVDEFVAQSNDYPVSD